MAPGGGGPAATRAAGEGGARACACAGGGECAFSSTSNASSSGPSSRGWICGPCRRAGGAPGGASTLPMGAGRGERRAGGGGVRQGGGDSARHCRVDRAGASARTLLDVVVGERAAVLELLAGEDQALLVGRDALLVLDLGLHIVDRVRRLDLQGDGLTCGRGEHQAQREGVAGGRETLGGAHP